MKNTLVKYLDFEANEEDPDLNLNHTQIGFNPDQGTSELFDMSVCTPESVMHNQSSHNLSQEKSSLNLLVFHDDSAFHIGFIANNLRKKGVKIVDLPSFYDAKTIVPFLLLNDHCILLAKNPKKDVL